MDRYLILLLGLAVNFVHGDLVDLNGMQFTKILESIAEESLGIKEMQVQCVKIFGIC